MPTILIIHGWRIFFYANEGDEPIHVHCQKGETEAKYWLEVVSFDIIEAHAYNLKPADRKAIRRIIFQHFDYIVTEWNRFQELRNG